MAEHHSEGSNAQHFGQWSEIGLFLQEAAAGAGSAQPQGSSDIKWLMSHWGEKADQTSESKSSSRSINTILLYLLHNFQYLLNGVKCSTMLSCIINDEWDEKY